MDEGAGVEDRRHLAGGAGEAVGVPDLDPEEDRVGLEEPEPVGDGEEAVERGAAATAGEEGLQARAGQPAHADRAIDGDRVAGVEPAAECLRIVVGHLVDDRESPHLHREERDVAAARPRREDGDRDRPRGAHREGHRTGHLEALSHQGKGDRGAEGGRCSGPDGQSYRAGWPRTPPHQVGEYRSARSGRTAFAPLAVIRMAAP